MIEAPSVFSSRQRQGAATASSRRPPDRNFHQEAPQGRNAEKDRQRRSHAPGDDVLNSTKGLREKSNVGIPPRKNCCGAAKFKTMQLAPVDHGCPASWLRSCVAAV